MPNGIYVYGDGNVIREVGQSGGSLPQPAPAPAVPPAPPKRPRNIIITKDAAWTLDRRYLRREDELKAVDDLITRNMAIRLQVCGIGGIGKTTFCCDLFWFYYEKLAAGGNPAEIHHLGWISYNRDLKNSVFGQLDDAGISEENPALYWEQAKALFHTLGSGLLLFIDNADQITAEDLKYLLHCPFRVIVTARGKITGLLDYELPPLDPAECEKLYRTFSGDSQAEDSVIRQIVERAGFHTQTVELLARTQEASCLTASELLAELTKHGFCLDNITETVPRMNAGEKSDKRLIEHLAIIFDIAKITDPEALRILKLFSLLAANTPVAANTLKDWMQLSDLNTVNKLADLGWLNKNGNSFSIHPVIAGTVQYKCKPDSALAEPLVEKLTDALEATEGKGVAVQNALLPHCVSVDKALQGTETNDYAWFLDRIASILKETGDYDRALSYRKRAVAVAEKVNGTEHPNTAATYNNIAIIYDDKGDHDKALEYYEKARIISEKVLGTEHPDTAATYHNIAVVYQAKGDYDKALEYYLKALSVFEKVRGAEHPDTAATYCNIGLVYQDKGDYDKALEYALKDLAITEKVLGAEHSYTAMTYGNIAFVYFNKGDCDMALDYAHKAEQIFETVLGYGHPYTQQAYSNLAKIYEKIGNTEKAQAYKQKAGLIP